jgi:hypothetical protein
MQALKTAAIGCALAQMADLFSTVGLKPHGRWGETNPLMINLDGSFNFGHGLTVKLIAFVCYSAMAMLLYLTLRHWDKRRAEVIASSPYLYFGILALGATLNNVLLRLMP